MDIRTFILTPLPKAFVSLVFTIGTITALLMFLMDMIFPLFYLPELAEIPNIDPLVTAYLIVLYLERFSYLLFLALIFTSTYQLLSLQRHIGACTMFMKRYSPFFYFALVLTTSAYYMMHIFPALIPIPHLNWIQGFLQIVYCLACGGILYILHEGNMKGFRQMTRSTLYWMLFTLGNFVYLYICAMFSFKAIPPLAYNILSLIKIASALLFICSTNKVIFLYRESLNGKEEVPDLMENDEDS